MNLIDNGLGGAIDPTYGGWGGRYELYQSYAETRPIYTNSRDTVQAEDGSIHTTAQATIWRWRKHFQHDFAARMDWCVADRYDAANHNPVAAINGTTGKSVLELKVKPGEEVHLSAEGSSDPDGDRLTYRWFQYPEAGTLNTVVQLSSIDGMSTRFTAPTGKASGTIHVILQIEDDGNPSLVSYRRAVITRD